MKIIIVSDNHGHGEMLDLIKAIHPDADLYLHAGDSEATSDEIYPFLSVKGNRDYLIKNPYRIIELDKHNIYMFHGDRTVLINSNLYRIAKKNNCDIIIFGHIHQPHYMLYKGVHIICPGSLAYPRSEKGTTYVVLTIDDDVKVEFKDLGDYNAK